MACPDPSLVLHTLLNLRRRRRQLFVLLQDQLDLAALFSNLSPKQRQATKTEHRDRRGLRYWLRPQQRLVVTRDRVES